MKFLITFESIPSLVTSRQRHTAHTGFQRRPIFWTIGILRRIRVAAYDFTIQKRKANILLVPKTAKGALWAASHISAAEKEDSGFVLSIEDYGDIAKAIIHAGFTVEQPR
jgi:hypothetical protein